MIILKRSSQVSESILNNNQINQCQSCSTQKQPPLPGVSNPFYHYPLAAFTHENIISTKSIK